MTNKTYSDDISSKRHSVSSLNSLNTFRSISTYQTYITLATGNNTSKSLSRNESRRLLDKLEFTAEEEILIKTLKKNLSSKNLLADQRRDETLGDFVTKKRTESEYPNYNANLEKLRFGKSDHDVSKRTTSSGVVESSAKPSKQNDSFKFIASNYLPLEGEMATNIMSKKPPSKAGKISHSKTKSWSISNSKEKNDKNNLNSLEKEEITAGPAFVKQHKKKNSSFSIKNLFKKPHQPHVLSNNKINGKYDSFQSFEHFQNNGNDEEFMNNNYDYLVNENDNFDPSSELLQENDFENARKAGDGESLSSQKRRNLISSEVPASTSIRSTSFNDSNDLNRSIEEVTVKITDYMNRAILLKQNGSLVESTDCLLLSILEYKKRYLLLKKLNRTDQLIERTPFLLYGVALKMGIGCQYDLESSTENLKIACGLLAPVDFENDDVALDKTADEDLIKVLDPNNLLMPDKFISKTNFNDFEIVGPAFYELGLNYLHPFLELSISKNRNLPYLNTNYGLNQIQEGLKFLSKSIVEYNHVDSFPVLLEIFAKGIKMSKIFVIRPNKNRYETWLKICDQQKVDVPSELRTVTFSSLTSIASLSGFSLKRNDTLERLNNLKSDGYLSSDDDEHEIINTANSKDLNSIPSILVAEKHQFEESTSINHVDNNESDDDLSAIMDTYL